MKLRISGNSIRLRLLQSEVERLRTGSPLTEVLYLGTTAGSAPATFAYALESGAAGQPTHVRYADGAMAVVVAADRIRAWATADDQVGIYDALPLGEGRVLDVMVEKDFACLDGADAENVDTFPNPQAGTAC